ncbi:serum response factor-like [Copidosoma floridanum]|uniref:serum response factor-like n=1 Tax=Copidosoma floridanum TaxID=29053 RepID=UPI0006C9A17F|nr:serum response factor-like [Copidosoma floridanum]
MPYRKDVPYMPRMIKLGTVCQLCKEAGRMADRSNRNTVPPTSIKPNTADGSEEQHHQVTKMPPVKYHRYFVNYVLSWATRPSIALGYHRFATIPRGALQQAYELSTLTGTQVMLLVASETGHVYTFATRKLQPMITSEAGKALIQTCLNSPDPPLSGSSGDQRMSATGFEETELTYNIADDEQKVRQLVYSSHGNSLHSGFSPSGAQTNQHITSPHSQHSHLIAHAATTSQNSHLAPCSSPSPMLTGNHYVQSCTSPLPPHLPYHSHISHSHNQR